jgi:hypothetical protein
VVGDGGIPTSELPMPMPLNAKALDDDAAEAMLKWYANHNGLDLTHQLLFGPDINVAAVKAKARTPSPPVITPAPLPPAAKKRSSAKG